jgi:hypothetical protein
LLGALVFAGSVIAEEGDAADEASAREASKDSQETATYSPPPPPVGVRHAEPLEGDRLRLAYRWERIKRQGLMDGGRDRTQNQVRQQFPQTPRRLDVTIHSFEAAWAPHPRVTLVAELPFIETELERIDPSDTGFKNSTDGIGDFAFTAVVPFIRKRREASHIHVGFHAPTGSIRRRDGQPERLPYDAQIGNGTWDLEWGWTYRGETDRFSWGGQMKGVHPVGRNDLSYREGSRFDGSIWGGARLICGLSTSLRFAWIKTNNTAGQDRSLDPDFDPSMSAKLRGGHRLELGPGLALDLPQLRNQRLAFEASFPVWQDVDGPQLERDWSLKAGWQWVF